MAIVEKDGDVQARLDRLQKQVEEQGRIIEEQKARLDGFSNSGVSRMLHATGEKDKTSRRDLLKRAGVAAAAAIGGAAVLEQPALAATGGNFILGNANDAGASTRLSPTSATFPQPLFKGTGVNGAGVALQGNASGTSTFSVGIAMFAKATGGAWGVLSNASGGIDYLAVGSGRIYQKSQAGGVPGFGSSSQEQVRDAQGLLWLSNGAGGWYPAGAAGLNIALFSKVVTTQLHVAGSNGSTWADMDATNLHITITPTFHCQAVVSLSADLWTNVVGFNQDIGIRATSSTVPPGTGLYPTTAGQPEGWKESSGARAFSPNAAYLEVILPMRAGLTYNLFAVWKTNVAAPLSQSIFAGAGPIGGKYSPTRMTVNLVPDVHGNVGLAAVAPKVPKARRGVR